MTIYCEKRLIKYYLERESRGNDRRRRVLPRALSIEDVAQMSLPNDITVLNKDLSNTVYALLALPTIERQSNDNAVFCNQYARAVYLKEYMPDLQS